MNNMSHIDMLKECCRLRGLSELLIHRTIHEFDWFCAAVVWGGMKGSSGEEREIYNRYRSFYDGDISLEKWIELFYDYCLHVYGGRTWLIIEKK